MPIRCACQHCGQIYNVKDEMLSRVATCKKCGKSFVVESPGQRKPSSHVPLTGADTQAGHPGNLRVDWPRLTSCYPKWFIILPLLFAASIAATAFVSWWFLIAVVAMAAIMWLYWYLVQAVYIHGNVCPSVVVEESPFIVAAITDLSTTDDSTFLAVKVIRPPRHVDGLKRGDRVVCVATYSGGSQEGRWDDFTPRLVNCATNDQQAIQATLNRIHANEWNELQAALRQVPTLTTPGLYPVKNS
jgi:hypothetical protein